MIINKLFGHLWTAIFIISVQTASYIDLNCKFNIQFYPIVDRLYSCIEQNDLNIQSANTTIWSIVGTHTLSKNISDVKALSIDNKNTQFLPTNTADKFKNLIALTVNYGRLKELQQKDIKDWNNLKYLNMDENDIEILEIDLFIFNTELSIVWFRNNKIRSTSLTTFDHLSKLTELDLVDNICVSKYINEKALIPSFLTEIKGSCVHSEVRSLKQSQLEMLGTFEIETNELMSQIETKNRLIVEQRGKIEELSIEFKNLTDESRNIKNRVLNCCQTTNETTPNLSECIEMIGQKIRKIPEYKESINNLKEIANEANEEVKLLDMENEKILKENDKNSFMFWKNYVQLIIVSFVITFLTILDVIIVLKCF